MVYTNVGSIWFAPRDIKEHSNPQRVVTMTSASTFALRPCGVLTSCVRSCEAAVCGFVGVVRAESDGWLWARKCCGFGGSYELGVRIDSPPPNGGRGHNVREG